MTTSFVSEASAPTERTETDQKKAIRDYEIENMIQRIGALHDVFLDELIDLEAALPEDWVVDGAAGLVPDSNGSSRVATESECRQFRVILPEVTFDVGADIRRQVHDRLIDLASSCLQSATLLRGPFEPLDDEDDEAAQDETGSAPF